MIPDWDTNHLFFADRLEIEFPALMADLRSALPGTAIDTITGTSDVWCRDYIPIQLDEGRFCQFVYSPDYLVGFEETITPPNQCRLSFMEDCRQEPIVLDGGNVVASRTKVILTDKVFKENPGIEQPLLQKRLEHIFQSQCIFIPTQEDDDVGHSDGVVRFTAEDRVIINDFSVVDPGYGTKVRAVLEKSGLKVETLPMFEEKYRRRHEDLPSAVGIYINYLRVGNAVVIPSYGRLEDDAALSKFQQVMPNAIVTQIPCRQLAAKGGVLNCVSWTIKDGLKTRSKSEA